MFSSGGSEANETNFKLVRMYWALKGEDRRKTVVARNHGYHGLTIATMSATGIMPMHWNFGPEAPGFAQIPAPYCFRCELGKTFPECGLACADSLTEYIEAQGPETIGAFIAEPVIGAGGIIPPPPGYFEKIREICDRYGILFIADEVVCGFGRTGKMFGMEHYGVRPDIVTLAKGITSGYMPLGASVVSDEIWQTIAERLPDRMPFSHGFTYSGHPVACAAALANLDIIEQRGAGRQRGGGGLLHARAARRAPPVRLGRRRAGPGPHGRDRVRHRQGDQPRLLRPPQGLRARSSTRPGTGASTAGPWGSSSPGWRPRSPSTARRWTR